MAATEMLAVLGERQELKQTAGRRVVRLALIGCIYWVLCLQLRKKKLFSYNTFIESRVQRLCVGVK